MKALSIQQPWAHLILHHGKDVENRTWSTKYRGEFLIHAGLRIDKTALRWARMNGFDIADSDLLTGGFVGRVSLCDVVNDSDSPWAADGCYHFLLANPVPMRFVRCSGKLGFFRAPELIQFELPQLIPHKLPHKLYDSVLP